MSDVILSTAEIEEARLDGWALSGGMLRTRLATGNFVAGLALVNRIGEAAEEANHHPDLDLRYPHLDVALVSHDVGGITQRDLDLARLISQFAADAGVAAGSVE